MATTLRLSPEICRAELSRIDICHTAIAEMMNPHSTFDEGVRGAIGELIAYLCERRFEIQDELNESLKATEAVDRLYENGLRHMGLSDDPQNTGGEA